MRRAIAGFLQASSLVPDKAHGFQFHHGSRNTSRTRSIRGKHCPPPLPLQSNTTRHSFRAARIISEICQMSRRDGRVAEGARLESVYTGNRIGGSNPSLSASFPRSGPETWVTQRTDYIGDNLGPNGLSRGSRTRVSKSKYPKS